MDSISLVLDVYKLDTCRYFHGVDEIRDYFEDARTSTLCQIKSTTTSQWTVETHLLPLLVIFNFKVKKKKKKDCKVPVAEVGW